MEKLLRMEYVYSYLTILFSMPVTRVQINKT